MDEEERIMRETFGRTIHATFFYPDAIPSLLLCGVPLLNDEGVYEKFRPPYVPGDTPVKKIIFNHAIQRVSPYVRLEVESERSCEGVIKRLSEVFADSRVIFDYQGNMSKLTAFSILLDKNKLDSIPRQILDPLLEICRSFPDADFRKYGNEKDDLDTPCDFLRGEMRAFRISGHVQRVSLPPASDDSSIEYSPSIESPFIESETIIGGNYRNVVRTFITHTGDMASTAHIHDVASKFYLKWGNENG
jgi:hypothetical protein